MERRRPCAALRWNAFAVILCAAVLVIPTGKATSDLIAAPPAGAWTAGSDTGPMTVADVYGDGASYASDFADAYQKTWTQAGVALSDGLVHYTSMSSASNALTYFKNGSRSAGDAVYTAIDGFGKDAFEITYPANGDGYAADEIWFASGDYLASILIAAKSIPRDVLLDQANRQFAQLSIPGAEPPSKGFSPLRGILPAALVIAFMGVSGTVIAFLLLRRLQAPTLATGNTVAYGPPSGLQLSEDRRYWWDGHSWQDTALHIPPWAQISPDGARWWDGASWRELPAAGGPAT